VPTTTNDFWILDYRRVREGLGFARVQQPSGQILNDCTVGVGERGPWAAPPSKPQINRDGMAIRDANGKVRYSPCVEFASKEARDRWSAQVIAALRLAYPDMFA
jgi:hypothetical protein